MATARLNVGVVEYLNARPLVDGLGSDGRLSITADVPSALADALRGDAGTVVEARANAPAE